MKIDSMSFNEWLAEIGSSTNFDNDIKTLNFGLFETKKDYAIYLIGSKIYDDIDSDWATNEDFIPENKYFYFKQKEKANWTEFEKETQSKIKEYLNQHSESIFNRVEHITIGFDDGDLTVLK